MLQYKCPIERGYKMTEILTTEFAQYDELLPTYQQAYIDLTVAESNDTVTDQQMDEIYDTYDEVQSEYTKVRDNLAGNVQFLAENLMRLAKALSDASDDIDGDRDSESAKQILLTLEDELADAIRKSRLFQTQF